MRKIKMQKRPKSTDSLLKTSKEKDIELGADKLNQVVGGTYPKQKPDGTGGGNVVGGWDLVANKVHS
jgi:hypothetical protein